MDDGAKRGINRRTLLVGGGAGAGLVLLWSLWPRSYQPNLQTAEGETAFNAYLKIGRDGRVIVAVPQAEIGQGSWTALPQILADELGADWRTVAVEPAPISPLYANMLLAEARADETLPSALGGIGRWAAREYASREALMLTGGSTSVRAFEAPLREAGAGARTLLQMAAADRWNADWEELDTREGFVWRGAERIPFAELADAAGRHKLPDDLPVRGGLENRLAGQPLPRLDLPAKVDGSARFAGDVRLPDMVYAATRAGPPGSTLRGVDREAAARVPGMLTVVENPGFVGAVAENWWAAARGLDALAPQFSVPARLASSYQIEGALAAALESGDGAKVAGEGDVTAAFAGGNVLRAHYGAGLAPSSPIEPLTATARLSGDRLEIWAPTQAPGLARAAAARAAGMAAGQVTLYPMLVGGGYGRKLEMDAIAEAAILAVRLRRPVQLVWPRIAEIARDRCRPAARAALSARLAPGGQILGYEARIAVPSALGETAARLGLRGGGSGADPAAVAGALPPYAIPAVAIAHIPADLGLPVGIGRGGAHSYTCFFTECFLDELARQAGIEPLSFRMQMLNGNPRLARVLSQAAAMAGWDGGQPGSALGIAGHSAFGSHIGLVVEAELTGDRRPRALRVHAAVDCGRVVNPDIVRQQVEGGIVHGLSQATGAPLDIVDGVPAARSIADLDLPLLADAPEIRVEILDSEEEPGGVTELGVPPAAPALANALYALAGNRVRQLPFGIGR